MAHTHTHHPKVPYHTSDLMHTRTCLRRDLKWHIHKLDVQDKDTLYTIPQDPKLPDFVHKQMHPSQTLYCPLPA